MQGLLVILGLLALASVSVAFRPYMKHMRLKPRSLRMSSSDDADEADTDLTALAGEEIPAPKYSTVAISGCISKESKAADVQVFNTMFGTGKFDSLTAISDDIAFAKKRLVSPKTVYSGLIDVLDHQEATVSESDKLEAALTGRDAWISFNTKPADLDSLAAAAVKAGVKRAVFAVNVPEEQRGANITFDSACEILSEGKVLFTIVKYGETRKLEESRFPYRVVTAHSPLPSNVEPMATDDLCRIMAEIVDIPKTFNSVYGVGGGTLLDAEVHVYMKSQGWPERTQVAVLMGDFLEKMEVRYEADKDRRLKAKADPTKKLPAYLS